jgi:uncharacterized protein (TIGR04552 family)
VRLDALELDETPALRPVPPPLTRVDEESVRLALTGQSVIDWTALAFRDHDEVNLFLKLSLVDVTQHDWARERLRYIYNQAVNYLEEHVGLTFPADVRRPHDVRDAFVAASNRGRFSRHRIQYCAILKLMHVINHLEMQELRNQCAIREVDLIERGGELVLARARQMRAEGVPLRAFYGNRKTRPSVITKLLAKREATAATIFDKLRFRVVTETRVDLVPAIAWLFRNLIPFCQVIPGESHNNLLTMRDVLTATRAGGDIERLVASLPPFPRSDNPHSGDVYRVVNFIVDLPVRVYDLPGMTPPKNRALLGEAVPLLCEFQVVDAETDRQNEAGENRHELYKARQTARVWERLGRRTRE